MFPFDSTLFIGILIAVTLIIYALILRKLAPRPVQTKLPLLGPKKKPERKLKFKRVKRRAESGVERRAESGVERRAERHEKRRISKSVVFEDTDSLCSQYFGYLRTLPKNTSIPDECLGCSQIVDCLTHVESKE